MAKRPAARQHQAQRSVTYTILFLGTFAIAVVGVIVAVLGFLGFGTATQFTASGADKVGGIQTTSVGLAITFLAFLAMVLMATNKPKDVMPFEVAPMKSGSQRFVDWITDYPLALVVVTLVLAVLLVVRILVH